MARSTRHSGNASDASVDCTADSHLADGGLSFFFDAGEMHYQLAIASKGGDALAGADERDYFWGRKGDDRLAGNAEDDDLHGDKGNDVLTGGSGRDLLDGGRGDDSLYGGDDGDNLIGRDGDDFLDEGIGHGNLEGGPGNDTLVGGQGPDAFVVDRESGNDVIGDFTAGPGMFDHLAVRDLRWEDLTISEQDGGTLVSWDGGSVLLEGVQKSQLAQDDFMFADQPDLPPGARKPSGPASERPSPSTPGPEIEGGDPPGTSFEDVAAQSLSSGGLTFDFKDDYQVGIASADGGALEGGSASDHLFGRGGADQVIGAEGDDVLQGDDGADTLDGGDGMDRLDGGRGNDSLLGGAMADELMGGDGDDYLDAGAAHDMIEGGAGNDTIKGGTGADAFIIDPDSGHDVVRDFEATGNAQGAFDHIALMGIQADDLTVDDTATGVLVSWDFTHDGTAEGSILLEGVRKSEMTQSDFMFVSEPQFVSGISDWGSYYIFPV